LIIFLAVGVTAAPRADANPRDAFEAGDFPTAAAGFQDQEVGDPDQPAHSYNRALSQFKAGQYAEAAQGFERAASAAVEPRLKQDSWFNLGNARVGAGKLPEAKAAFEQALALDPGDRSARENLEYVKKLIEEQKKQQEQKQDEQQDQNQDQNQDQQQNDQKNDQSQPDEQQNQQDKPSEQDQQQNDQKDQQQQQDETQNDQQSESPKPDEAQQGQDEAQKPSDQAGAPQDEQQEPQRQAAQAGETKDMNEQEAERLLQSVEDQATKYHYRPEAERGAPPRQPEKDW
jgi:Ca-activated chloride channel family protein